LHRNFVFSANFDCFHKANNCTIQNFSATPTKRGLIEAISAVNFGKFPHSPIWATNPGNTLRPVGASGKLLQAVKNSLRWTGVGLVLGKRTANYGLDYSLRLSDTEPLPE
jgi:hypothetical protein